MSSPLSSLNKFRKLPILPSTDPSEDPKVSSMPSTTKPSPYRYSNDEGQLMHEVTTRMALDHMKTTRNTNETRTRVPTDLDLLQLTMSRMQKAESDVRYLTSELKEKTQRVSVLEEKVKLYEKALQAHRDESYKIPVLEKKCIRLQSIIDRMEDLLIERGLEVVGELDEPDNVNILTFDEADRVEQEQQPTITASGASTWRPDESVPSILPIDFNTLVENIRELNVLAGETEMHFETAKSDPHHRHISTLKRTETVPLTIYANGVFLFNGPFRPYTDPTTQQFIRDILDGYFPTELQKRFPDGVPFDLTDKRETHFNEERKAKAFQGEGYVLHDGRVVHHQPDPSHHLPPIPQGVKVESSDQQPKISATQFLNRLPKAVIKNGQVIDIRQDLENRLNGKEESMVRCESARSEYKSETDPTTPVSTLRIRSHDGQQTYVIKMRVTSTIKDVKQTIAKKKKIPFEFDLFAMGTKIFFTDDNKTLEECGLIPNATLGIRETKH